MVNLKQRRLELGLTMLEVANALGVSEATISRYESGNIKNMRRDRIGKYAKVLKVNPAELIGIDDDESTIEKLKSQSIPYEPEKMIPIPVVGNVAAGYTCLADTNIECYELVDADTILDGYEYIFLRVKGDSMEPKIEEGDLVLVRLQEMVDDGDYAVVIVDAEDGVVKRISIKKNEIILNSINPYYPPRTFQGEEIQRVRIVGKVIESKRKF